MNTKQFVRKHRVSINNKWSDSNPYMPDSLNMNHWKVTLKHNGRQYTTYYSMGYGLSGEPTAADALDCLASDAAGYENARSFEDWAGDYGYDTDSRKAERIFRIVGKQADKLKTLLGDNLYNTLLWGELTK